MTDLLTNLLAGNLGTLLLALILWKSGLLKYLLNGKKDNGQMNELIDKMDKLECHYNSDTTAILQDIKQELRDVNQKLENIELLNDNDLSNVVHI